MSRSDCWWQLAYLFPSIVGALLAVLASHAPGGDLILGGIAVLLWIWAAIGWVGSLAIKPLRRPLLLIVPPLLCALCVVSSATQAPIRVALSLSESALHERSQALMEGEEWTDSNERIGLFSVSSMRRWQGVTEFTVGSGGFLITCGLAHSPGGPSKIMDATSIEHLSGDWYVTCTDFD